MTSASGTPSSLTDAIGIGTLTRLAPRELADEIVASEGRAEVRGNKLPARVMVYFVMAMTLFYGGSCEEVMRKLAGGLDYMGTWQKDWETPGPGGLRHARKRLGAKVMRELCERAAVPCAMRSTKGAWPAGRRLMAVDGFGMEAPDSEENAGYFGYAGKKGWSAVPLVRTAALAECGTHAIVAAEIGEDGAGGETPARSILSGGAVEPGMIVMADAGPYGCTNFKMVLDAGADALFRAGADVELPVPERLPDGPCLTYSADSGEKARSSCRLRRGLARITGLPGFYARAVDCETTDRGDGEGIITLVANIAETDEIPAAELAAAYHQRWEGGARVR